MTSRADVPHDFFYTARGLSITCLSVDDIASGRFRPIKTPGIHDIWIFDWADLTEEQVEMHKLKVKKFQRNCRKGCKCTPEGEIEEDPRIIIKGGKTPQPLCADIDVLPERCGSLYGCTCTATLYQPAKKKSINGATRADYQRALDGIPSHIRLSNPRYAWRYAPGGPLQFTEVSDRDTESDPGQRSPPAVLDGDTESDPGLPDGDTESDPGMRSPPVLLDEDAAALLGDVVMDDAPLYGPDDGVMMPWDGPEGDPWTQGAGQFDPWEGSSAQGAERGARYYYGNFPWYGDNSGPGSPGGGVLKREEAVGEVQAVGGD
ncbi:hypothetical protein TWF481_005698 [Arthrobotrys musiformis]|uniref:Uncharacterized protein n=1 Tax=Arthrobotrys musiformis TaxID=47236 RepID=A0AAV9WGI8_9PEZI